MPRTFATFLPTRVADLVTVSFTRVNRFEASLENRFEASLAIIAFFCSDIVFLTSLLSVDIVLVGFAELFFPASGALVFFKALETEGPKID